MAETNENIWTPWRMEYIESLADRQSRGCFFCEHIARPEDDARNHVLWRSAKTVVLMNRFPYTAGHLLVAPVAHEGRFEALADDVLTELMLRLRDAKRVLETAMKAQGFNIGMNLSRCAGAGVPEHLHWHVVPRWNGDTNFMPVLGGVTVIPEALDRGYERLVATARQLGM